MRNGATWAVVPVKSLQQAKQRLAPVLSDSERAAFALAMLEDVLSAVTATEGLRGFLVVSDDPDVRHVVEDRGGRLLREANPGGLSAAVAAAASTLAAEGAEAMLFLPGDLPLLTSNEVARLMAFGRPSPAVIVVPSHDGQGTNAILCRPPDAISFRFGGNSFQRHCEAARLAGIDPLVCRFDGLSWDIDEPGDLIAFAQRESTTRSHAYLKRQGIAARLTPGNCVPSTSLATASH